MIWRITNQDYNLLSKLFHWVTALIVLGLLSMGVVMVALEPDPLKFSLYSWHKSLGLLVLLLTAFRFVWRFVKGTPGELATHRLWERLLAKTIHALLYVCLIGMPLTGWLMSGAGEFPVTFFGIPVPEITGKNEDLFERMRLAHTVFAYGLIVAIGLHVAGALKHHFIDRDVTLARITTSGLGMIGGVFVAVIALGLLASPVFLKVREITSQKGFVYAEEITGEDLPRESLQAQAKDEMAVFQQSEIDQWVIDYGQSRVELGLVYQGAPLGAHFEAFEGVIYFDPERLDLSYAEIAIETASLKTGSADRDTSAVSAAWLDSETFKTAVFKTQSFEAVDANHFIAKADLTLHGVTIPVELPFTLEFSEGADEKIYADMEGFLTVNRLDFGIGEDTEDSLQTIANPVEIRIFVRAQKVAAPP